MTLDQYREYAADVHNGMDSQEAYEKQILPAAKKAGYLNAQTYIDDIAAGTTDGLKKEAEDYESALAQVPKGTYSLDDFLYEQDPQNWTPATSQILRAHAMGMTMEQFNNFMKNPNQPLANPTKYTKENIDEMNRQDYEHLQDEILSAGYSKDAYKSDFTRNKDVALNKDVDAGNAYNDNYSHYVSWGVKPNQDVKTSMAVITDDKQKEAIATEKTSA
jgi:hypothetical protein